VSVLYPFLLLLAAVADMIGFADLRSLAMVAVGAVGACLVVAGGGTCSWPTGGWCGGWRWPW